jgi:hypothetical protein
MFWELFAHANKPIEMSSLLFGPLVYRLRIETVSTGGSRKLEIDRPEGLGVTEGFRI